MPTNRSPAAVQPAGGGSVREGVARVPVHDRRSPAGRATRDERKDLLAAHGVRLAAYGFVGSILLIQALLAVGLQPLAELRDLLAAIDLLPLAVGLAFTVVVPAFLVWAVIQRRERIQALHARGQATDGEVVVVGKTWNPEAGGWLWACEVRYEVAGAHYQVVDGSPRTVGEAVEVLYDPRSPRRAEVNEGFGRPTMPAGWPDAEAVIVLSVALGSSLLGLVILTL